MIDTVMLIEERFTQMEQFVSLWGLVYDLTRLSDKAELLKLCQGLDHAETPRKCRHGRYRSLREADLPMQPAAHWMQCPPDVLQFMLDNHLRDNFPNTWVLLRILLTLPVSVATAERSFSKLKLIKTYL
ncbi:unnamed protein product [Ixodes pacificus]